MYTIPYWLNGIPTREHNMEFCNLHTYINNHHKEKELES
jgi:hypothetical protein